MAYITEFEVSGLVGRRTAIRQELRRDVNVFFGPNGSGKTSLLKIIHAAMIDDTRSLARVPFRAAKVVIFSDDYRQHFTAAYEKPKGRQTHLFDGDAVVAGDWVAATDEQGQVYVKSRSGWVQSPERKDKVRSWRHRYLPTSRLYGGGEIAIAATRHARDLLTSEDELENVLAQFLDRLWTSYSAEVLGSAKRVQEEGLTAILRSVLAKRPEPVGRDIEPELAYQRAVSFLGDQATRVLGTLDDFARRFEDDAHMQNVMAYIARIQERVERLTAPRNELQKLVSDMFSGTKRVVFTDNKIEIRAQEKEEIPLASLSSGEKQLMRILLETLVAERNTIIIDEPEISMHVDWQRRLISAMRQLNPQCQVIIATHSPEIMADVPDENIFRI